MKHVALILVTVWLAHSLAVRADPVLPVINDQSATPLLRNGDFEQLQEGKPAGWHPASKGFRLAAGGGRNSSHALACENASGDGWFGASQTLVLNRTQPAPLIISGWSKAAQVTGGADNNYSLYVDLTYTDGTPLWGQTGNFRAGTHDWQLRQFTIFPEKPVKTLTLHCLFRGHGGTVWFDDVSVAELAAGQDVVMFQGVAVQPRKTSDANRPRDTRVVESGDGLRLTFLNDTTVSLQIEQREFRGLGPGGFLARDAAAGSGFFSFQDGVSSELGLKLETEMLAQPNYIDIRGSVSDMTGRDRAITLVFAVPIDSSGWKWGDDIRRSRVISGRAEFANPISVRAGATGTQSLYPVAPVWDSQTGVALALDWDWPAVYRAGYHAGLKLLFLAYDFGLVKDTERFPSSARFSFVLYRFPPSGGFRAAWQKFTEIFPDYFVVRSKEHGLWMPFTDVSKVKGWQDFGFRYHEGNNNVPWDDEHGILSFRYTEPMTWWMPMKSELPRTLDQALGVRDEFSRGNNEARRRMAEVTRRAAMHDEADEPALLFRNTPWANGAVWSLNPNPWLRSQPSKSAATTSPPNAAAPEKSTNASLNAATVHWNDSIKQRLYGPDAKGRLDGEYLDSLEGYVTAELNFRREHFQATTVPLTFSSDTKQPALFKGLAVYEFTRWIAADVHGMGKLLFANGVPYRFTYLCPWLDVLGTETDWLRAGKYHPVPTATTDLWRTLSGAKPYLLLMNTDYDQFTPELVEKYFQRALFYGMWPGFFSHNAAENPYWQNPRWYERDRPLFQKYIPLIKQISAAGWQPASHALADNERILIERFGPTSDGTVYLTLFNDSSITQTGTVTLDLSAIAFLETTRPKLLLGPEPERAGSSWRIALSAEQAAVWQLSRSNP